MDSPHTDPVAAAEWMKAQRTKRGWSTIKLADVARAIGQREGSTSKLTQQSVSGFEKGDAKKIPEWFRYVRMAFEEGEPLPTSETSRRDELVYIKQVDIQLALGHGSAIDEYPAASLVPFNLDFIQSMARSETEKLVLFTGVGDSMEPVILKHDMVLVDTGENRMSFGDTFWAFEYAGAGYIKRLRSVMRDGARRLIILSVNPDYPPEEADPGDVRIIGKVVWIARRM